MAKKKIEERTVEVDKGNDSLNIAIAEVKKLSGFDAVLPIRGRVVNKERVEYDFFVGTDLPALQAELFQKQLEAERSLK